ncbi:RibD family protein [Cohnella silvisoli]|uniref:RibD family protein n=1 Tax=Cohnella silvisoli TaxID=2873699 RepID=A0ABV1KR23_9BACL|nr:RibD family protein [Cohnella silvisoli]
MERVKDRLANAASFHRTTGLPYCTITYAQSIDGSIAAGAGCALAISGMESLKMTHSLRANHDAILVGIETVLADDPLLTVRLVSGEHPQPVVLDTNLRFPEDARILSNPKRPWLMTGNNICQNRRANLEQSGARVYPLRKNDSGQVDLSHLLRTLGELGIRSLMIEGGARVIAGFLEHRLGNQLIVTTSPMLVGGLRPVGMKSSDSSYPLLSQTVYEQWGADMVMASDLEWASYVQ